MLVGTYLNFTGVSIINLKLFKYALNSLNTVIYNTICTHTIHKYLFWDFDKVFRTIEK